jgi:hypothetical protein
MGAGLLGLLAVATGITLFQPDRIVKHSTAQIALRCLGVVLAGLTVWAAWLSFQRVVLSSGS